LGRAMAERSEPDLITVYDERGRELRIERSVWERDVLQPNAPPYYRAPSDALRKLVVRWLDEATPGSVLDRLAPAVLKRLGETERLTAWLKRAPAVSEAAYAAWLERVRQAAP